MTTQITVPLNKLAVWEGNVRKTADDGLPELAASIAAHGLLQPLVVRKGKRGKYAVIAGGRRHAALQLLARESRIDADMDIPCTLREGTGDDLEVSLAENVIRAAMHPADQFEAFRQIIDDGASVPEVAARFGIAESTVNKRLRLGRLSPVILSAYRAEDIDLEQAMAFTLSDDHQAQERVFSELAGHHVSPYAIRRALTQGEIPATDKRAQFIGLEAYEQAGGTIRRDLFDDQNAGYIQDPTLLDKLVSDKLRSLEPEIKAEGWAWTQVLPEVDYSELSPYRRIYPDQAPLSPELEAELAALETEADSLSESEDEEAYDRLDQIQERMDEIEDSRTDVWSADVLSVAGAIITLGRDGMPDIYRGLIKPEDQKAAKAAGKASSTDQSKPAKPAFSASLVQELTARRTAALTAELMDRPDIALVSIVHAVAGKAFYDHTVSTCLQVSVAPTNPAASIPKATEDDKALASIEARKAQWGERLPADHQDLWSWSLKQPHDVLLDLLAVCTALTVDATIRGKESSASRIAHTHQLAEVMGFDMANWFNPNPDNYLNRVSRDQIATAYREAKGHDVAPAWQKLKKAEMAARVAEAIDGSKWLPSPIRPVDTDSANDNEPETILEAAE